MLVTVEHLCFIFISVSLFASSHGFEDQKSLAPKDTNRAETKEKYKDARLFTAEALQEPNAQTDQWKAIRRRGRYTRILTTPDMCKAYVQGLVDSEGELAWDEHRCTVLTLVVKCNAKVRILTRSGLEVLAEGEDKKEIFLEILVDEGHKRTIPLDGVASRDLAILVHVHNLQEKGVRPDFHVKRQKELGSDFFAQDQPSSGWFPGCG
ncbi:uncharacterized protein LOC129003971 [Macrosteles quadrilineatus]|uniref:uncharacterized protein LOC129003971 n=1 Tax=Macrosteles quadrilineatus TaxID=74068 RepID=UPI0023E11208|nr:uncharacterized protein LOC129003971 [Macrosteles quadrilineatus]